MSKILAINLQLFADGAGAGDGAAATGVSGDPAPTGSEAQTNPSSPDEQDAEERQKAYSEARERFKAEIDAEVQGAIKDRVKNLNKRNAELSGNLKKLAPILQHHADKYGKNADDLDGILAAFADDEANYEKIAEERDLTLEQAKAFGKLEYQNRIYREQEEARIQQEQFARWDAEAEELKVIYPEFDIEAEMKDPVFLKMMDAGVDLRTCYEVRHKDDIVRGAMSFTANKVAEKVSNAVAANSRRPTENGLAGKPAAKTAPDISKMNKRDIEELYRRARAGERIDLKNTF